MSVSPSASRPRWPSCSPRSGCSSTTASRTSCSEPSTRRSSAQAIEERSGRQGGHVDTTRRRRDARHRSSTRTGGCADSQPPALPPLVGRGGLAKARRRQRVWLNSDGSPGPQRRVARPRGARALAAAASLVRRPLARAREPSRSTICGTSSSSSSRSRCSRPRSAAMRSRPARCGPSRSATPGGGREPGRAERGCRCRRPGTRSRGLPMTLNEMLARLQAAVRARAALRRGREPRAPDAARAATYRARPRAAASALARGARERAPLGRRGDGTALRGSPTTCS